MSMITVTDVVGTSGTVTVEVASSAGEVTSARECRKAAAAGANASCALTVTPRTTCPGSEDPWSTR